MLSDSGKPMLTLCVPNFVFGWQQLINVTVLKAASCCTAVNPFLVTALSLTLLLVIRVCYCGVADSFWIAERFSPASPTVSPETAVCLQKARKACESGVIHMC